MSFINFRFRWSKKFKRFSAECSFIIGVFAILVHLTIETLFLFGDKILDRKTSGHACVRGMKV